MAERHDRLEALTPDQHNGLYAVMFDLAAEAYSAYEAALMDAAARAGREEWLQPESVSLALLRRPSAWVTLEVSVIESTPTMARHARPTQATANKISA
jgi:hypothetical protein